MSIIGIQRRMHEDGRIRIGQQVPVGSNGKTRPAAIDRFRFTSQNRRAIDTIAATYGGQARPWEGAPVGEQWETFTEAAEIPVVVPPETMSYSQWYELWSGGGCKRRCDGEQETISDGPCVCDPDNRECKPHTRLSLMLAHYPGTGLWRLDTGGWNAAAELGGAMEMVGIIQAATGRSVLPGHLRLEHRTSRRDGETRKFVVPVLSFDVDMAALAAGKVGAITNDTSGESMTPKLTPVPIDDAPAPSLAAQLEATEMAIRTRRLNSGPEVPATGRKPRPAAEVTDEPERNPGGSTVKATNTLRMRLRDNGITSDKDVHDIVSAYVGREVVSLKDLTPSEVSSAIESVMAAKP